MSAKTLRVSEVQMLLRVEVQFGSTKKQVLGVQHRSGAGGLVKRGSRALWGARGAESGRLNWKVDIPVVPESCLGCAYLV